jgi:hypothetical protein
MKKLQETLMYQIHKVQFFTTPTAIKAAWFSTLSVLDKAASKAARRMSTLRLKIETRLLSEELSS